MSETLDYDVLVVGCGFGGSVTALRLSEKGYRVGVLRPDPGRGVFGRDGAAEPGVEVEDQFFGGVGPARRGCVECGECMTGCRHGAKNTLAFWPNHGDPDSRPAPEDGYRRLAPIPPRHPVVPEHAPAALHLGMPATPPPRTG